jgi:hypothetical protein
MQRLRNGVVVLLVAACRLDSSAAAEEKTFQQRFEVRVPARGAFGSPPRRTGEFDFVVPPAFDLVRDGPLHGAVIVNVNLGGLTEVERKVDPIERGVKITWTLKNEDTFPLGGRSAFLVVDLKGNRTGHMALSPTYNTLRRRFLESFFFQGRVAEFVDNTIPGRRVKFADQTIYLGQALMAFSTELAVLRDSGADSSDARARLATLLDAVDELDREGDAAFGGPADALNGFFVRDDIEGPADMRLGNRYAVVNSDFQDPASENASPSGDQIFGLMNGLFCVQRYSADAGLTARAKAASSRLYDYARRSSFELKLPNGEPTRRGSDVRWLASLMHGLNKATTGADLLSSSRIRIAGQDLPLNGIASFWDSPSTASSVERLAGGSIQVPLLGQDLELNSFSLHILLMALAPSEVWDQGELERAALRSNHHLSVLLYAQVHGTQPQGFDEATIRRILDACPDTGPRASLDPSTGWARDNRWVRCSNIFEPAGGNEEYNGIDWMVLHNLHQLVYAGG